MKEYLTNKGLTIGQKPNNKFVIEDGLGCSLTIHCEDTLAEFCKKYRLHACALKSIQTNGYINPDKPYSVIINDHKESYLSNKIGLLLELLRQIEDISSQLLLGSHFRENVLPAFSRANEIQIRIREGHITCKDYEKMITDFREKNENFSNAILVKDEIARLGDLIRTEVCHAEYCLINSIISLRDTLNTENSRSTFSMGEERICYGYHVDSSVWSFTDSIKSISTVLDSLSKLLKFIFDINFNNLPKTRNVLFGDLKHIKNWNGSIPDGIALQLGEYFDRLKIVQNFRHHITHNSGLFNCQNSVFAGVGTPSINNLKLAYCDLLIWDYEGDEFKSSQRKIGFFSQQNNAIEFGVNALETTVKYVEALFRLMRQVVLEKCKSANMTELSLISYNLNNTILFETHSINKLEKMVIT